MTHLFDPLAIRDITFANRRKPTNSSEVESKEFYVVCGDALRMKDVAAGDTVLRPHNLYP